jgi:hypothetical protein
MPSRSYAFLLWLLLPFVFYLVPLVFGYAWNSLSESHNVLDPLEGYVGRTPDMRITVEAWGASVLTVPLHARLNEYLRAAELPLWNPYQGLGEPYQAQGDGSPYFPVAVLRSLLPYSLANYVSFASYYVSAIFLYLFLRGQQVSEKSAIVAGIAWTLCGALSLHIARPEFSDQIIMMPVLFWSAARAIQRRGARDYVVFALVTGLTVIAGHIQIAMILGVVVVCFVVFYSAVVSSGPRDWLRHTSITIGAFIVGVGLGGFYLLPLAEGLRISYNKDPNLLSFSPIPFANVIAFFFPMLFGYTAPGKGTWLPGDDTQSVAWDNLHAYIGTALLLIVAVGAALLVERSQRRPVHAFFFVMGVVLLMRYISAPPVAAIDLLPVLGRQSPKHGTELTAFCFIVASAFAIQSWRAIDARIVRWILLGTLLYFAGSVLTLIGRQGGFGELQGDLAVRFSAVTSAIVVVVLFVLWLAHRWRRLPADSVPIVLGGAILAELSIYIPLGNSTADVLYARLGLFAVILLGSLFLALRQPWIAAGLGAASLVAYTAIIIVPDVGLPRQFDVDAPPQFMRWLKASAGEDYRSFGIAPDFSSIDAVQDMTAVGPLAPEAFYNAVQAVGTPSIINRYSGSTTFTLAGLYDFPLDQYAKSKPIFDWLGVRYLVMDRSRFGVYSAQDLLATGIALREVYHDSSAAILQSDAAAPKAEFWSRVQGAQSDASIVQLLQANPSRIAGPPLLQISSIPPDLLLQLQTAPATQAPVQVDDYRPNHVRLHLSAPAAGVVVLKDSYFPGWSATVNGQSVDVIPVNAMVRGIVVPGPGDYDVAFDYLPTSFVLGVWLSVSVLLLLVAIVAWDVISRRASRGQAPSVGYSTDEPDVLVTIAGGEPSHS